MLERLSPAAQARNREGKENLRMPFNSEKFLLDEVARELPFQPLPRRYDNGIIIRNERDRNQQMFIRVRGTSPTVTGEFLKQLRITRFEVVRANPESMRVEKVDDTQPHVEPPAERIGGFSPREIEVIYSLTQAGDIKPPYQIHLDIDPPILAGWTHINKLNGQSSQANVTVAAGGPQTATLYKFSPYREDVARGLNTGSNPQLALSAAGQAVSFYVQVVEDNQDGSYDLSVSYTLVATIPPGDW